MRVHAESNNKNVWSKVFSAPPSVTLDGAEVENVIEADDEEGFVEVMTFAPNSSTPIYANGRYITKRLEGVVVITGERRADIPAEAPLPLDKAADAIAGA